MLFAKEFHEGIRAGRITLAFRAWTSPRTRVGARYRFGGGEAIEVTGVEPVALNSITRVEAQRAGYHDTAALQVWLHSKAQHRLGSNDAVYRVGIRYVGRATEPVAKLREDTSAKAVKEVIERLDRMDERSRRKPWTRTLLDLIARHPRTAAAELAPEADRPLGAFKTDVRKLRSLGLTVSHDVGYSLSPRGEAVLAASGGPAARTASRKKASTKEQPAKSRPAGRDESNKKKKTTMISRPSKRKARTGSFDDLISGHDARVQGIARKLRSLVKRTLPRAEETAYLGWHVAMYAEGGQEICGIQPVAGRCNLYLSQGAELPDPDNLLEGSGKSVRHVKVHSTTSPPQAALQRLMRAARQLARD